ncbi:hypothetical protein ACQPW3_04660 [Actinosynnema sp. CA-248983]
MPSSGGVARAAGVQLPPRRLSADYPHGKADCPLGGPAARLGREAAAGVGRGLGLGGWVSGGWA